MGGSKNVAHLWVPKDWLRRNAALSDGTLACAQGSFSSEDDAQGVAD